jgi:Amidase
LTWGSKLSRSRCGGPAIVLAGEPGTVLQPASTPSVHGSDQFISTVISRGSDRQRADAPPSARVREAGCVMLGKTTMPDFGMLASGVSSLHGTTRNPWNLARNPGGSSSGAGAGLVAGYAPLALGGAGAACGLGQRMMAKCCRPFEPDHARKVREIGASPFAQGLLPIAQQRRQQITQDHARPGLDFHRHRHAGR